MKKQMNSWEKHNNNIGIPYFMISEILKRKIRKDYGKKCKDFSLDCYVCRSYLLLTILEEIIDIEDYEKE